MTENVKLRGAHLRKISVVFLAVCLLNIGWSFPFFHKKTEEKVSPSAASRQTTPDQKTTAQDVDSKIDIAKQNPDQLKQTAPLSVSVIASRLPSATQNINNIASNVTFKDSKELGLTHPMTFQDAVRDTEGATFYDEVGNGADSTFSLRGFNSSSAMIFLVDGVRVNEVDSNMVNFPLIPMRDVQSIQIERGSSSAVYGSNAFAGVVNITTGQASPKPVHLFGGLEWSSFHGLRFNQGVSGTIQDKITPLGGKFTYYFNGERDNSNGFRNHSELRLTSFDIKTAYELPDDQGRFYVNIKHIVDGDHTPGEVTLERFQNGGQRSCNKPYDGRKFFNTVVSLGADKRFWDDHILASIMYSERLNKRNIYTTYGTFTSWTYPQFDPYTAFLNMKSRDRDLTWQIKYDDQWKWLGNESLLGMEVRKSRQTSAERYAFQGNIQESLAPTTDHSARYANAAIFWRETLNLFDKVIPYFGMRHDFNWLHTADALTPTNNISQRLDKSTLSTGLTVKPFKWADVFGNYSQGFRVPTMDETVPYAGANQVNLKPEKSGSYEVGTRLRYKDTVAYKLSYFLIDVENEIHWDNVKNQYYNIAQTRRYGIEQRVDVTPVQEVQLYGSYTWMTAFVHNSNSGATDLAEGRGLGQVPANRFTLGGTATPLKRWGTPYDGFKLGLNGDFTGRQHPSSYETYSQATLDATGKAGHWIPGYSVWNFITSFNWKEKEIYFKVNNIFGEKYYSRAFCGSSWGSSIYPAGTYTWVNPGAGREFILGTKWEF